MENRFDLYDLPGGHEVRFEKKLDRLLKGNRRRARAIRWMAAAAGLAAVLWFGMRSNTHFGRAHSPEAVYTAYLEQVGKLYELVADNSDSQTVDWESLLHELTDENVPLYDQLPEEMPAREKTQLLKKYYGGILNEAGQIQKEMNKENK